MPLIGLLGGGSQSHRSFSAEPSDRESHMSVQRLTVNLFEQRMPRLPRVTAGGFRSLLQSGLSEVAAKGEPDDREALAPGG